MKGIIFNLLESYIEKNFDDDIVETIFDENDLITKEPFVGPGTYPDEDLYLLIDKTSKYANKEKNAILFDLGKHMLHKVLLKYPEFTKNISHPKDFILSVDQVIHVEVKKLYPDATTPGFIYKEISNDKLEMTYLSNRKFCFLAEGLLEGTKEYFGKKFTYKQTQCKLHCGDRCLFEIIFHE